MTFRKYAAFFQPDELDALTSAYDAAWQEMAAPRVLTTAQASVLKSKLAQIILASACTGDRDRERLRQIAVRAISGDAPIKERAPEHC
jgi:hypothetical protein